MNTFKIRQRYRHDRIFKALSFGACLIAFSTLLMLFAGIIIYGLSSFFKTEINLKIDFSPDYITYSSDPKYANPHYFNYENLILSGLYKVVKSDTLISEAELTSLISLSARKKLYLMIKKKPTLIGHSKSLWLAVSDDVDGYIKSYDTSVTTDTDQNLTANQTKLIKDIAPSHIRQRFNKNFFTGSDSREPASAGILGAALGSLYLILITLIFSFPIGVATAIYLEEFSRNNRLSHWIEVSISNLAAVPSIVFGILGLAVFINIFHLPRSSPLVGGLTLALLALPTIIVTTRAALRLVPRGIKDAAYALGASSVQVTFHHVFPLALPGILTGVIMSMARALGETAPLLMVGMMAFVSDLPHVPTDAATTLPVQIFMWSRNPEPGFIAHAAAAILVLLIVLGIMNLCAILLRNRFEHKW